MGNRLRVSRGLFVGVLATVFSAIGAAQESDGGGLRSVEQTFRDNCAVCHGDRMQGAAQGTPLVGQGLQHGDSMDELAVSIARGFPEKGMPGWNENFTEQEIKSLALWIRENRDGLLYSEFNLTSNLTIPTGTLTSAKHAFTLETIVENLDPLPYSLAVLPDGDLLVTEKMRGMRIISLNGEKSELILGTPKVYDDGRGGGARLLFGKGWLLDVALHPEYETNGWIYLHHTDRCSDCSELSRQAKRPVSMNRLIRGRIRDGEWVDEQVIWQADVERYGLATDVAAGGRTAFDPEGYVFISVGMHGRDSVQDLTYPDGKIHRVHDDGRIPGDNPFTDHPNALKSIWTYGHRSPQGLEFKAGTGELWSTEHGPRGGDEINLLLPGRNYGWPLFSKGQNYDGTEVGYGRTESEIELQEIEQPVVDWTPSPAISSFIFYEGEAFPGWQGQLLVGTLKAADLVRVQLDGRRLAEQEMLIDNLSRIRDIETDAAGLIYLLLEHDSGGRIVRMVPQTSKLAMFKPARARIDR